MSNGIARPENMMQGLLRLHRLALGYLSKQPPQAIDWKQCKRELLLTDPPFKASVDSMIAFVAARSGGPEPWTLMDMAEFHSLFVHPSLRTALPNAVYNALADSDFHLLAIAIWKAAYVCPLDRVQHGICQWVTKGEIDGLRSKSLSYVEKLLADFSGEISRLGVHEPIKNAWHSFQCNVASACLGKPISNGGPTRPGSGLPRVAASVGFAADNERTRALLSAFATFETTLTKHLTVEELQAFKDYLPKLAAASVVKASPPMKQVSVASRGLGLNTIDKAGKTVNSHARLRAEGFDVGMSVQKKTATDKDPCYTIVAIDEVAEKVELQTSSASSGSASVDVVEDLRFGVDDFFEKFTFVHADHVKHPQWPTKRLHDQEFTLVQNAKAQMLVALDALTKIIESKAPSGEVLDVYSKPKMVRVREDVPAGSLVLVPECRKVQDILRASGNNPPSGAVEVTFDPPMPSHSFWLLPATSADWVVPFWWISTTSDNDKVNMKVEQCSVSILSAADYAGETLLAWGQPKKRKTGKAQMPTLQTTIEKASVKLRVRIPVLVNTDDLSASGPLLRWAVELQKVAEKKPISMTALVKKQM